MSSRPWGVLVREVDSLLLSGALEGRPLLQFLPPSGVCVRHLLFLLLMACPKAPPTVASAEAPAPGCPVDAADDLPDPLERTDPEDDPCEPEKYWDTQPGATTFFVGDYTVDSCGVVSGHETWVIHPNAVFAGLGFTDCSVVWTVDGRFEGPLTEGSHTLSLRLTVDEERSDCKPNGAGQNMWDGEENAVVTYAVDLGKEGVASLSFADSGTPLGDGHFNASHLTFVSPASCKYF